MASSQSDKRTDQEQKLFWQEVQKYRSLARGSRIALTNSVDEKGLLGNFPLHWLVGRLVDIADIKVGYAFKSSVFQSSGTRLVRGINVSPGKLDWTEVACINPQREEEFKEFSIQPGDILLAMDRPIISTGLKVAIARESDCPSFLVQRVARIRPRTWALGNYIWHLLNSQIFISHAIERSTGSDLPHISSNDIGSTPVPIPPLKEQDEICCILNNRLDGIRRAASEYMRALQLIDRMERELLSKAFRGELVPQDPNDEPASVMLMRIQNARKEEKTQGKRGHSQRKSGRSLFE